MACQAKAETLGTGDLAPFLQLSARYSLLTYIKRLFALRKAQQVDTT
jgi:hypothetical protein